MDIFRTTRDAWGQETLEGVSWDLLPIAFGLGIALIVGHLVWRAMRKKRSRGGGGSRPGGQSPVIS